MTDKVGSDEGKARIGVMGLGVMGKNLALNIEDHGFSVAVYNRDEAKTARFVEENAGKRFTGTTTLEEFVRALERPRSILLMIKAGEAIDRVAESLTPLLDKGDILIDGGNSHFADTRRREEALGENGIRFFGLGVSGGERGARFGPSLMPGGNRDAYEHLKPILEAIAAKTEWGPCVSHIGPDGSGHFVKMVHNGIEYGVMQLIAEAYDLLRQGLDLDADNLAAVFAEWNRGPLESFLVGLTAKVLTVKDPDTNRPLVDLVLDRAGQKGTGRWTVETALALGVPIPTITAALEARVLSSLKSDRVEASGIMKVSLEDFPETDRGDLLLAARDGLYAATVCSYAQGMNLIRSASDEYGWNISTKEVARIWTGGCIIRADLLRLIMEAYEARPGLRSLLLDGRLNEEIGGYQAGWRMAVRAAAALGIPVPATSASLAYFDGYRTANLPQNLLQAQRDAFGSHTYQRTDRPEEGFVHTDWL
ncbi:MAG: NADP-dependent phosphogluconate dehydrogenase [Candidatus Eisenbacteria sp.]|nr:NADP-dependent phosphogluconate dehydrogenase [Candidatus Eisenbacteria bacterium]